MVKERWAELQSQGLLAAAIQEEKDYIAEYEADLDRKKSIATDTGYSVLRWITNRIAYLDSLWAK